jgi:hypothetical protein
VVSLRKGTTVLVLARPHRARLARRRRKASVRVVDRRRAPRFTG